MTGLLFPVAAITLPIAGSALRFAVRRVFCVGRNYADHITEMGGDPRREAPFFFTKPADALVTSGQTIPYPPATADLHHEAELVIALHQGGADLTPAQARAAIWGHATGNDLTRRDLQAAAKAARRPWDMAKGFDRSAIIGLLHERPPHEGPLPDATLHCTVNGRTRQSARLSDMIWPTDAIVAHLSTLVSLAPGDLIFTGTPAGVGPLHPGDTCTVHITGLSPATVSLANTA